MEIFLDKEKYDSKKVDPLNTIINARFHSVDEKTESTNGLDTIGFDTQQYFKEGYRLSTNPKLLKRSDRHPIFSYVPENFNFSAGNFHSFQFRDDTFFRITKKKAEYKNI